MYSYNILLGIHYTIYGIQEYIDSSYISTSSSQLQYIIAKRHYILVQIGILFCKFRHGCTIVLFEIDIYKTLHK